MSRAATWLHRAAVATCVAACVSAYRALPDSICIDDGGDFQMAAITLGIQHPPGYPLLSLVAHPFTRLFPSNPAFGVTLFNWLAGIAVLLLTARCLARLGVRPLLRVTVLIGLIAWRPFWELWASPDVYMSFLLMIAALTWAVLRVEHSGRMRPALLSAAMLGCILATRNSTFMYVPGILLGAAVILLRRRSIRRGLTRGRIAALAGVCLLPILLGLGYLWLRDAPRTTYNYLAQWSEGTAEFPPDAYDAAAKWQRLKWLVSAQQYWVRLHTDLPGIWYRWMRAVQEAGTREWLVVLPLVGLAAVGGIARVRRRPVFTGLMLFIVLGEVVLLSTYVIEEQWTFLLPITWSLGMLAACGAEHLLRRIHFVAERKQVARIGCYVVVLIVIACSVWQTAQHWRAGPMPSATKWAAQPRWEMLPRNAVIITHWTWYAPLHYGRLVLAHRPDIHVLSPPIETWPLPGLPDSLPAFFLPDVAGSLSSEWRIRAEHGMNRIVRYAEAHD